MKCSFCIIILLGLANPLFTSRQIGDIDAGLDTLPAKYILLQARARYSHIRYYVDSGTVSSYYYGDYPEHTTIKPFKTAYADNGRFSFEYYDPLDANSLYTINRTANGIVKSWWGVSNRIETPENLVSALDAVSGISESISKRIPRLLLQEYAGEQNILDVIQHPIIAGSDLVNGLPCYKIIGLKEYRDSVKIWIQKTSLLILKVETDGKVTATGNYRIRETYSYFPSTPLKIDDALFHFIPNRSVDIYAGIGHRMIYSRFGVLNGLLILMGIGYLIKRKFFPDKIVS